MKPELPFAQPKKGTTIVIGIPPRTMTLGDLLPENTIIQSAVIRININDAVRVSCDYVVKEKDQ